MPTGRKKTAKPATETGQEIPSAENPARSPQSIRIVDTPGIQEQYANQVLDVFLINGHTVSMTFGAKRTVREETLGERETVIAVNARLTIDLAAAEALRNALAKVIAMTKQPKGSVN